MKTTKTSRYRVNYGINRGMGRKREHACGHLFTSLPWGSDALHAQVRARIMQKHPGWRITGYCIANHESRNTEQL